MNEKTVEEIRKEIREAVDCACRAFAKLGRAMQRIVSEVDWDAIAKACEECDEESDEKEGLKTLADFVRETGIAQRWPEEFINVQCASCTLLGHYKTTEKAAFDDLFARVNRAYLYGETESDFEAEISRPTETYYFGPVKHRKFGAAEYTIREIRH